MAEYKSNLERLLPDKNLNKTKSTNPATESVEICQNFKNLAFQRIISKLLQTICIKLLASEKLEINGHELVLEKDGTAVDEDAILFLVKDEVFILLEEGEEWLQDESCSSVSSCSTLTLQSNLSEINKDLDLDIENDNINILELPIVVLKESTWDEFIIPWEKLQDEVLEACGEGRKEKHIITETVHMVIAAMRQIKTDIHSEAFRTVARKMGEKYPKLFKDYDEDGQILGSGYTSIFNKLVERNSYLNRPHKQSQTFGKPSVPFNKRRKLLKLKAGCSNWDPPLLKPDIKDIKTLLKNIDENDEHLWEYLEESYAEQRNFINNCEDLLPSLLSEWPIILLNPKVAIWHFKKLTGSQFEDITPFFNEKCKKLIKFGEKRHKSLIENAVLSREILAIQILTFHHKEKIEKIFFHLENADQLLSVIEPCVIETDGEFLITVFL
ncbi:hypothetical protein RN001_007427 [Aquatica leii]|uniref:CIDE-N domain-containing protein n=1 Tax=Aquatica leii TaxID=1421715 RepID=A0AAN7PBN7_9COLE|nr:hypothetical protein RN001_007427 [Aquatica leii]